MKIWKYLLEFELKRLERSSMELERVRTKRKLENKINNLEKKIEKETDDVKLKRLNVRFWYPNFIFSNYKNFFKHMYDLTLKSYHEFLRLTGNTQPESTMLQLNSGKTK